MKGDVFEFFSEYISLEAVLTVKYKVPTYGYSAFNPPGASKALFRVGRHHVITRRLRCSLGGGGARTSVT